ncbi:MAG: hypothetical protein OXG72_16665 [Acidobacteria bacterium]|nr:hypothetical protein [Acidobacteriota bacterium]
MPAPITTLRKYQTGKEARNARGTEVDATRRLYLGTPQVQKVQELEEFPDDPDGTWAFSSRAPVVIGEAGQISLSGAFDFVQCLLPLLSGYAYVASGTQTADGSDNYQKWTFAPSAAGELEIDTFTFELEDSDGDDQRGAVIPGCFTNQLTFSGAQNGLVQMAFEMMGRPPATKNITSGLALPGTLYAAPARRVLVKIADTWAGLATASKIEATIYGWQWQQQNAWTAGYYTGGDDVGYQSRNAGQRQITCRLDIQSGAAAADVVPTQELIKKAGGRTFVQIELVGDRLTPTTPILRRLAIKGCYTHAPDSMGNISQDNAGRVSTAINLKSFYDPTSGKDTEMVLDTDAAMFT